MSVNLMNENDVVSAMPYVVHFSRDEQTVET